MTSSTLQRPSRRMVLTALAASTGMASLVSLVACGATGQPGSASTAGAPKGKVTFMSQGTDPTDEQRYKPLIDEYNARKGPVTIDLIQGDPGGGAVNAQGKLLALVAADSAPDVFWTHAYITPNLYKLGMLADISGYLKKDKDIKLSNYFEAPTKDY